MTRLSAPRLLVGIDTESDNQWDARSRAEPTFDNLYALPELHDLFRRHDVRPTYVVTYPVARDPRSIDVIRGLHESGTCEIGAHHHTWETPPFGPEDAARHAYASALPVERVDAQIAALTEAVEEAVGRRPVTYRSGRFGFAASHVACLERHGYLIDSSVAPLFQERHKGGPEFVDAPLTPYFLSYDDATTPGTSGILEVPLSAGLSRRVPRGLARAYANAPFPYTSKRILRKLGLAHVVWLRPSYSSLDEMRGLARRLADEGEPVLNICFHSSEAIVGGSPYNRTADELRAFLDRLEQFLDFATIGLGAVPMTLAEFGREYAAGRSAQPDPGSPPCPA